MSKVKFIEAPFTNKFGTVNVGDTVVAITTGYSHRVRMRKAKYVGYIESTDWRGNTIEKVKLEVEDTRNAWFLKGTDTEWKWDYKTWREMQDKIETRKVPYTRKTTLQLNRIAKIAETDYNMVNTISKLV